MVSGKPVSSESIREGITESTGVLTQLAFRGGYPDLDQGVNIVRESLTRMTAGQSLAPYIIGTGVGLYLRTAEIFGSPPDPIGFSDAYLLRTGLGFEVDIIKRQTSEPVQNPEVEYRLRRNIVEDTKRRSGEYGLSMDAAASMAGLYVSDAILPRSRGLQELSRRLSKSDGH